MCECMPGPVKNECLQLSLNEQRLFGMIIKKINSGDDPAENTRYHILPDDYEEDTSNASRCLEHYNMFRTAGIQLMRKYIIVGTKQSGRIFSLVCAVAWDEEEKAIDIELSRSAKNLILSMISSSPSAPLKLQYSASLNGKYTQLIYNMLQESWNIGNRTDFITDLRKKLKIPESYSYEMLKRNVFINSVKEINSKTNMEVSFKEIPEEGCAVQDSIIKQIQWTIKKKNVMVVTNIIEEEWTDDLIKFIGGRKKINHEQAVLIVQKAQKNNLTRTQMKKRVDIVLKNCNTTNKNFADYCIRSMGKDIKSAVQLKNMQVLSKQ